MFNNNDNEFDRQNDENLNNQNIGENQSSNDEPKIFLEHYDAVDDKFTTTSEPPVPEKKGLSKKAKTILTSVAGVAIVAAIAFSSITLYRMYDEGKNLLAINKTPASSSEAETTEPQASEEVATPEPVNTKSWIELATRSGAITIPEIVDKSMPSVVGIESEIVTESNFPFGDSQTGISTGTGIVMTDNGYILTNAHVVDGATKVTVHTLDDEKEYEATIIGADVQTDIAVLKIEETGLTAAEFGDSDDLKVGELAVAIGNPLGFELSGSVTCGIISALNREISIDDRTMTLIQTDAAINSGNSGGPLINSSGQVIGINSIKLSSNYSSTTVEGLGFAIPMNEAKTIVDDLIEYGYVKGRPQLGITCINVSELDSQKYNIPIGAYVTEVSKGSAADKAGVSISDVIFKIGDKEITTIEELNSEKNQFKAGQIVKLTVYRLESNEVGQKSYQEVELEVVLQEAVQE